MMFSAVFDFGDRIPSTRTFRGSLYKNL